jgi:hypothetical protein
MICLEHDVLAERDADLESNLFLLARKLLPAYHDGAPQYCRVCEISALMRLFLSFFPPAIISPRQKFDKCLRKAIIHKSYRPRNVREELN